MEKIKLNMQNRNSKIERESSLGKLDFIIDAYKEGVHDYLKTYSKKMPKDDAKKFNKNFELKNMLEKIKDSSEKGTEANLIDNNYQIIATNYFENIFKSTTHDQSSSLGGGFYFSNASMFLSMCSLVVHYYDDAELTELEKSMALLFIRLKLAPLEKQTWSGAKVVLDNYTTLLEQIASFGAMTSAIAVYQGNANR